LLLRPPYPADAILAGDKPLIRKFVPGEHDLFRGRRLSRAKKKTAQSIRQRAERRERVAVDMERYQRAESRLIKREES
jgi:hypothetical protein